MTLPLLDHLTFKESIISAYDLHCVKHLRNRWYNWSVYSRLRTKCRNLLAKYTPSFISVLCSANHNLKLYRFSKSFDLSH